MSCFARPWGSRTQSSLRSFVADRRSSRTAGKILAALEMVQELTKNHVAAVNAVVAPALEYGDIVGTHENLRTLVNDHVFPTGYDEVKGILYAALEMKEFKGGTTEDNPLKRLLSQLTDFQNACFIGHRDGTEGEIRFYSFDLRDALEKTVKLWEALSNSQSTTTRVVEDSISSVVSGFRGPLSTLGIDDSNVPALRSPDQVVAFQLWCRAWQRRVQDSLYGGRGLNSTVGTLRFKSANALRRA